MLAYADVEMFVSDYLTNLATYQPMPVFYPGPAADIDANDISPEMLVIISLWPGAGLDSEQVFDRAGVQLRTIGPQMDYSRGEQLAQDCDRAMLSLQISQYVNNKWTLSIQRAGGSPTLIQKDNGDRYHFYCNYIWEVEY
jgi:hypothetical protein